MLEKFWQESQSFKIQQKKKEWINFIQKITENNNLTYCLEIGCYDGGTTIFLSNVVKNLITIDQPFPARFDSYQYKIPESPLCGTDLLKTKCNFNYISGNSHRIETLESVKEILGDNKLDLLFIDGDHTYLGVKQDYEMYSKLVKNNGYIALHDIHESDFHKSHGCFVHEFWQELISDGRENFVFYDNSENDVWGGIGLVKMM
jgi:cephalosporin hydroxylase